MHVILIGVWCSIYCSYIRVAALNTVGLCRWLFRVVVQTYWTIVPTCWRWRCWLVSTFFDRIELGVIVCNERGNCPLWSASCRCPPWATVWMEHHERWEVVDTTPFSCSILVSQYRGELHVVGVWCIFLLHRMRLGLHVSIYKMTPSLRQDEKDRRSLGRSMIISDNVSTNCGIHDAR